jgi:methionyl-tRNA formyltransferase
MRIALFGQAPLAVDVLDRLLTDGHEIAAVYAPPDTGRPDALAERAQAVNVRLIRRRYFQKKSGEPIPAALEEFLDLDAELNVLASMTSFLPRAIVDGPRHRSICFHPSLLPRYRGGNAMQWQIILGERESGVTVFIPDDGVDTGPIVVQKGGVSIDDTDTTGSLFFKKLYPLGVDALTEAVARIASGLEQPTPQDESQATHQGLVDETAAAVRLGASVADASRLVRGCDPQPGAFVRVRGERVRLYDASVREGEGEPGTIVSLDDHGIGIAFGNGILQCGRVRADAGKESAQEWAVRSGVAVGDTVADG